MLKAQLTNTMIKVLKIIGPSQYLVENKFFTIKGANKLMGVAIELLQTFNIDCDQQDVLHELV